MKKTMTQRNPMSKAIRAKAAAYDPCSRAPCNAALGKNVKRDAGTRRLFRRFQALESLAEDDREAIIKVIDAMVIKHQAQQMVDGLSF
jgi:hypothetical protein